MNIDFPALLVFLTFFTGMVWLVDSLVAAKRRQRHQNSKEPIIGEYSKAFFPVIFIVLILRSFVMEPFRIPSGSMLPTLLVGDFILVNKFAYGLRLPVLHTKFIDVDKPQRGDVAVFRHPQSQENYIKRVVGVPGDVVRYENKRIYINNEPQTYVADGTFVVKGHMRSRFIENLSGVEHSIIINNRVPVSVAQQWTVPEGHYFVLGDNRDNSADSRVWGMFPDKDLVGEAFAIWMSWNSDSDNLIPINWERIGNLIQ